MLINNILFFVTATGFKPVTRSEERRVGKDPQCDWSSDVCSSDLNFYDFSKTKREC